MKLNIIESAIIICLGIFMHLHGLSIIELRYSKLPLLTPNAASSLFVLSVLGMLTKLRIFLPQTKRMPQKFLIYLVELALILYATDLILRQIWLPSLRLLNFLCHFLGQYIITSNQNFLTYNAPQLADWIRNEAFYIARFLLAAITFLIALNVTGLVKLLQATLAFGRNNNMSEDLLNNEVMPYSDYYSINSATKQNIDSLKQLPFDVYELPCVPQEDILNLANRVANRQKKPKTMRKTKRKKISSLPLRTNCANNNNNSSNNKSPNSDFFRHYNKLLNRIDIILNNVEDNNNNNNSNNNNNDKNNNQLQKNAITITRSTNDNKPNGQISKLSSTNLQKAQNYEDITISRVMKRKK
ncbi:hypothetical protein FF38_10808 [Lucilia cuprina]|uniref:Uncharacterized protein n=1 Tax=Lucilia cuprina TaxID=7375 RepID=A0A0L0CKN1_LUCCU|nr:hypothetical protein FF38_10808 [Lucilia cuprina]